MASLHAVQSHRFITPRPVSSGGKIAIIAPATHIRSEYVQGACDFLSSRGYEPVVSKHCLGNVNDYSGTIEQRFQDLYDALANPEIEAILCARGGYGAVHFIDRFEPQFLRDNAKWLVGFSDITALHAMMLHAGVKSIHGPMAKYMWENPSSNAHLDSLMNILAGTDNGERTWNDHPLNIPGAAQGVLAGGNMAVFNGLNGSRFDLGNIPELILFIEDVGEAVYRIERMLYNMRLNGTLGRLKGVIVGQFTEYDPTRNAEFMEQMIHRILKEYNIPVAFNAPFGHDIDNMPLVEGEIVKFTV